VSNYNAALVRYMHGHTYYELPGSLGGPVKRELYLEMGSIRGRKNAERIARQFLIESRRGRQTRAFSGEARRRSQIPSDGFRLGDKMDGDMIAEIATSMGPDGRPEVVPQLGSSVDARLASLRRRIERGAETWKSEYARPNVTFQDEGEKDSPNPPPFSHAGPPREGTSPLWGPTRNYLIAWMSAEIAAEVENVSDSGILPTYGANIVINLFVVRDNSYVRLQALSIPAGMRTAAVHVNAHVMRGERAFLQLKSESTAEINATCYLHGANV
jgi:hypothetical protein